MDSIVWSSLQMCVEVLSRCVWRTLLMIRRPMKFCLGSFRVRFAPLPLIHVSHIKSMLNSHRAGRVSSLFTDLDFCPERLASRGTRRERLYKSTLEDGHENLSLFTLPSVWCPESTQAPFLGPVCSCSLTATLQPDRPRLFTLTGVVKEMFALEHFQGTCSPESEWCPGGHVCVWRRS